MMKENCSPSNRIRVLLLAFILIFTTISCQLFSSEAHHFEDPALSFDYPSGWQTMEELWGTHTLSPNYNGFGMQEITMITSARKKGQFGAFFTVASASLSKGETLESFFGNAYDPIKHNFREESEKSTMVNGIPAFEIDYQRPSGEPWWQYRDFWLEKDGRVILLSFHFLPGSPDKFQEEIDIILNSFTLK
jgi:hypothetical protein